MCSLSVSPTPVLISWSSKNIPKRSSVSTIKPNLQSQHRRLAQQSFFSKRKPESQQCFPKPPKPSTPIRLFHIKIPECKLKKKNISLLAPSPSTSPPPAGTRNLLLNSAQPSLGRLHFYTPPTHTHNKYIHLVDH